MSKHQTVDFVKHFAFALRNADPAAYGSFLEAFDAYATEITVAVTQAPASEILNLQGRAAQTLALLDVFRHPRPISSSQSQSATP